MEYQHKKIFLIANKFTFTENYFLSITDCKVKKKTDEFDIL